MKSGTVKLLKGGNNPEKIIQQVSNYYKKDIFSENGKREYVFPRQVAVYMLMVFTTMTLKDIANFVFKNDDHGTVIYSNKQVRGLCRFNPEIRKQIIEIESQLE